jgi:hypothetical protein
MSDSAFLPQAHDKPLSTIKMLGTEHIVHEWQSAIDSLAQREREMIDMSKQFVEHINMTRDEMNMMLRANQTMLEESRRRGLQLKKLEAFFAEFPLPYSLRQPVASAFLSVGISMPWWTARPEPPIPQQVSNFSSTEAHDVEDLCARLRSLIEIKDQLTQKILDEQARHEAEMQSFILHHKQLVSAAQDNAILASTHWTIERLTMQSKIKEKETDIKILNQELNRLKQEMIMRDRSDSRSHVILTLPKPKEADMMVGVDRPSTHEEEDGVMVLPRMRSATISQPSPRTKQSETPNAKLHINTERLSGKYLEQASEQQQQQQQQQQQHAPGTFPTESLIFNSLNNPLSSPRLSPGDKSSKLQHQHLHDQWQQQLFVMHSKQASLHSGAAHASMLRGLKGTKMHGEFRGQGEGAIGSSDNDAVGLLRSAGCGKREQSPRTVSGVGKVNNQQRGAEAFEGN